MYSIDLSVLCREPSIWQDSEEFAYGLRELRRRLPPGAPWQTGLPDPATWLASSKTEWTLVILNPAVIVSDRIAEVLHMACQHGAECALPSDPRGFQQGVSLDYASRPGFDRFVSRLASGPMLCPYDGREPWLFLVSKAALSKCLELDPSLDWTLLPACMGAQSVIALHAFAHSYADYFANDRKEMLDLLPDQAITLLDVGGGLGNFARAFTASRSGREAMLFEAHPQAAAQARAAGLAVIQGDFMREDSDQRFDCISFLDVLEHLADPLDALVRARSLLNPHGRVLLSVPNVGHWSVVWDLLEGSFDYQPVGILCNTHLRFFTRNSLERLLEEAGFSIERWENVTSPPPAAFAAFLDSTSGSDGKGAPLIGQGVELDLESLATESFHVLARRD